MVIKNSIVFGCLGALYNKFLEVSRLLISVLWLPIMPKTGREGRRGRGEGKGRMG